MTEHDGMAVVLREPTRIPVIASSSISLRPNTDTRIAMKEEHLYRVSHPHTTNCSSSWQRSM